MYIADYLSSVKTDKEVKTTSENLPEGKQGINGVDRNQTRGRTGGPPKPSYTFVSEPVLMELIYQEHFKEQCPDNWREKTHPLTCMYCKGEMILHG